MREKIEHDYHSGTVFGFRNATETTAKSTCVANRHVMNHIGAKVLGRSRHTTATQKDRACVSAKVATVARVVLGIMRDRKHGNKTDIRDEKLPRASLHVHGDLPGAIERSEEIPAQSKEKGHMPPVDIASGGAVHVTGYDRDDAQSLGHIEPDLSLFCLYVHCALPDYP